MNCTQCQKPITFGANRVQYIRLLVHGIESHVARPMLPRCEKCVTLFLEKANANTECELPCENCGSDTPLGYRECVKSKCGEFVEWTCLVCLHVCLERIQYANEQ